MKVQLCILLRSLVMKYDGLGNFIINFCLEMLDFSVNSQGENLQLKFVDFNNNPSVSKMKIEDKIDVSLLILSILEEYLKNFHNQL